MKIAQSARKHYERDGLSDDSVLFVVEHPIRVIRESEHQNKELYLGVDPNLKMLEVVTVEFNAGEKVIIHAMKMIGGNDGE